MTEEYHVAQIPLQYEEERKVLATFLTRHKLTCEPDIQTAFGIYDENDTLAGCACAAGALLKCFAVEPELRGQNALGLLVSSLIQERFAAGFYDLFVITRRENEKLFVNCGLYPVVQTPNLVLLENMQNGPANFASQFRKPGDEYRQAGAIVMNCNPFTLGHRALIEYAVRQCDVLHIFVVSEDRSCFPASVRCRLVQEGTADLPNVRVHLSGNYMISAATFPTYFLKKGEDAAALQSELDITLFAECIAPQLNITKRFAGEEPLDPITAKYNDAMRRILPEYGIEFCEIPRSAGNGEIISASRVRKLLMERGVCKETLALVPQCTQRYLEMEFKK